MKKPSVPIDTEDSSVEGNSRRDFLKKAGKFAVYTPPAVMMLMKPNFASAVQKGSWSGQPSKSWKPSGQSWQSNTSWKPRSNSKHSWKPKK